VIRLLACTTPQVEAKKKSNTKKMSSYHQHVSLKQLTMNSKFDAYWMYFKKKNIEMVKY